MPENWGYGRRACATEPLNVGYGLAMPAAWARAELILEFSTAGPRLCR